MKLECRDGLLFVPIQITHNGRSKIIDNVVIDTGAAGSIISADFVEDIGIYPETSDRLSGYYGVGGGTHWAFIKNIDEIKIGSAGLKNVDIDFGVIEDTGEINGLIGMDILIRLKADIDLNEMKLKFK